MAPAFFVMAIMGCGDGGAMCTEARVAAARFISIEACQAAMPAALSTSADLDFPEIAAICRRDTPIYASADKAPPTKRAHG